MKNIQINISIPETWNLRTYVCKDCGNIIDRDFNASKNIESRALQLALA